VHRCKLPVSCTGVMLYVRSLCIYRTYISMRTFLKLLSFTIHALSRPTDRPRITAFDAYLWDVFVSKLTVFSMQWKYSFHCSMNSSIVMISARSELRKVLFLALSVTFLFVYEIYQEPLNGFAPNSQGSVWSLARTSLNVKVKGQRSRSSGPKTGFSADISRIAELICDKFTRKTSLVPRSDVFEGQGQFRQPACG